MPKFPKYLCLSANIAILQNKQILVDISFVFISNICIDLSVKNPVKVFLKVKLKAQSKSFYFNFTAYRIENYLTDVNNTRKQWH